jgi:hypothetical protein
MKVGIIVLTHTNRLRKLLEKILETQCVILEFYWVVNHKFPYFSFLTYTLLYYKCLICSILSKENNRILMKKIANTLWNFVFSNCNNSI